MLMPAPDPHAPTLRKNRRTMRTIEFAYKQDHPMDKRSAEAARIREKCAVSQSHACA